MASPTSLAELAAIAQLAGALQDITRGTADVLRAVPLLEAIRSATGVEILHAGPPFSVVVRFRGEEEARAFGLAVADVIQR